MIVRLRKSVRSDDAAVCDHNVHTSRGPLLSMELKFLATAVGAACVEDPGGKLQLMMPTP